jgi:hypothetical protein
LSSISLGAGGVSAAFCETVNLGVPNTHRELERRHTVGPSDIQTLQQSMPNLLDLVPIVLVPDPDLNPLHLGSDRDDRSADLVLGVDGFADQSTDKVLPDTVQHTRVVL